MKWVEPIQSNSTSSPLGYGTSSPREHSASQDRSMGMKAAKAKRRLAKEKDPIWQEMMNSVEKNQDLTQKQHEENLNMQKKEKCV